MVGFRKQTSQRLNQLDDIITTLSTRVQILEDERAATAQTLNDIAERTDALDARITATSTELARQLDELGTELSAVTDQEPVDVAGIVNGALDEIRNQHEVEWVWVRGHDGDPGNERADELARRGITAR